MRQQLACYAVAFTLFLLTLGIITAGILCTNLLARRIICDVRAGDTVAIGDTYGLIRFGSRLDTYLPVGTEPLVTLGQRAVAGETVLATMGGA